MGTGTTVRGMSDRRELAQEMTATQCRPSQDVGSAAWKCFGVSDGKPLSQDNLTILLAKVQLPLSPPTAVSSRDKIQASLSNFLQRYGKCQEALFGNIHSGGDQTRETWCPEV